jgi:hypothetical protein
VISCSNRRRGLARRLAARGPCRIGGLKRFGQNVGCLAGSRSVFSDGVPGPHGLRRRRPRHAEAGSRRGEETQLSAESGRSRFAASVQPGDRADRHRYRKPFLYRDLPGRRRRCTGRLIFSHLVQCRQGYWEGARVPEGRGGPKCLGSHHQPGVGAQD